MSNWSELFSSTTICSSFKWIEPFLLSYHVHTQTHRHNYSIVTVAKSQLKTKLDEVKARLSKS